jgi:hypothetical protein
MRMLRTTLLALALLLGAGSLAAQQMMFGGEMLDASTPRGAAAAELVQLVLTGDAETAREALAERAAPGLDAEQANTQLDAVLAAVGTEGAYLLERLMGAGDRMVIAVLQDTRGGAPLMLMMELEPAAPYRVAALRLAAGRMMLRDRDGGGELPQRP